MRPFVTYLSPILRVKERRQRIDSNKIGSCLNMRKLGDRIKGLKFYCTWVEDDYPGAVEKEPFSTVALQLAGPVAGPVRIEARSFIPSRKLVKFELN